VLERTGASMPFPLASENQAPPLGATIPENLTKQFRCMFKSITRSTRRKYISFLTDSIHCASQKLLISK
jgi:hypothetical protein